MHRTAEPFHNENALKMKVRDWNPGQGFSEISKCQLCHGTGHLQADEIMDSVFGRIEESKEGAIRSVIYFFLCTLHM